MLQDISPLRNEAIEDAKSEERFLKRNTMSIAALYACRNERLRKKGAQRMQKRRRGSHIGLPRRPFVLGK